MKKKVLDFVLTAIMILALALLTAWAEFARLL